MLLVCVFVLFSSCMIFREKFILIFSMFVSVGWDLIYVYVESNGFS